MTSGYEKVAGIIGEEMGKAWSNVMERLAADDAASVMSSRVPMASSELQEFFANLGGAQMSLSFSSRVPKGEVCRFRAYELNPSAEVAPMGFEGSISIGINIRF